MIHARAMAGADAADLLQDACVNVWTGRETYREGGAFWPWFRTVINHTQTNRLRGQSRRIQPVALSGSEPAADSTWEHVVVQDTERVIAAAMQEIEPSSQQLLRLVLSGTKPVDIAARLNLQPDSVRQMICRARRRLREALLAHE